MLVVDNDVELVIVEVDVVVDVVEVVVVTVGLKVVDVVTGGVVRLATPRIPLAGELDTSKAPTIESRNTRPSTSSRCDFFLVLTSTTSAIGQVRPITTFRASRVHQLCLVA